MKSNIDILDERLYAQAETIDWKEYEKIGKSKSYIWKKPSNAKKYTTENWRSLVVKYFPKDQVNNCLQVMAGESGGNPRATHINRHWDGRHSIDCGLMQLNFKGTICPEWTFDPEKNLKFAYEKKFLPRGWCPWYCSIGRYLCSKGIR